MLPVFSKLNIESNSQFKEDRDKKLANLIKIQCTLLYIRRSDVRVCKHLYL